MKRFLQFLRMTLVGGILFLVPIIVLVVILDRALALTYHVVDPLAEHLPAQSIIGLRMLLALAIIVLFCFLAGFIARTALAQKIVAILENEVLLNVPGYEFFKGLGESFLGTAEKGAYPVVLARLGDAWQFGFQIELLENGMIAVFVPDAPNPHSGAVYFMASDRVLPSKVVPGEMLKCLKRLGAGSNALLRAGAFDAAKNGSSVLTSNSPQNQTRQ